MLLCLRVKKLQHFVFAAKCVEKISLLAALPIETSLVPQLHNVVVKVKQQPLFPFILIVRSIAVKPDTEMKKRAAVTSVCVSVIFPSFCLKMMSY